MLGSSRPSAPHALSHLTPPHRASNPPNPPPHTHTKPNQVYKPLHASLDEMAAFHHRDYLEYLTVADRGGDRVRGGGWRGAAVGLAVWSVGVCLVLVG
jgi:hypothetical protein